MTPFRLSPGGKAQEITRSPAKVEHLTNKPSIKYTRDWNPNLLQKTFHLILTVFHPVTCYGYNSCDTQTETSSSCCPVTLVTLDP
jgi:hypothetical protein